MSELENIIKTLKTLVSFPSVTPKSEGSVQYVKDFLENLGFKIIEKKFGDGEDQVTNIYAYLGNSGSNICFAGHLDVVAPGDLDLWTNNPFQATVIEDEIIGRGVVDMKGAIACYLCAIKDFLQSDKSKNQIISVLLTTDEEGTGENGLKKFLPSMEQEDCPKIDFCILGEPTMISDFGDCIKIGRRGSVNFALTVIGMQGHVAYPDKAINPCEILIKILNDLVGLKLDQGNKYFQPSNLEITSIDVNNASTNVIPSKASANFNIRFNNLHSDDSLIKLIEQKIKDHTNSYEFKYHASSLPFYQNFSPKMEKFCQIIKDITKVDINVGTGGGASDARYIYKYSEVVELGLNSDYAHQIDEKCKIRDLQMLYMVYYEALVKLN